MILIVIAVFLSFGLSTGCKKAFDITGSWNITLSYVTPWPDSYSGTITFAGSKTSGTSTWNISSWGITIGTYTVSGSSITATVTWPTNNNTTTLLGTKTDNNNISGSISETSGATGTWTASR